MPFTSRSEKSRTRILNAAREMLADRGYEATTIRAVANAAGIDPSMVMRYYGNKEGLFAAAVNVDLLLPSAADLPVAKLGELFARHVVARWEGELSDEFIRLLLRSAGTNAGAAEQFRNIFEQQIVTFVGSVAGDGPEARRRAAMLSSQVLGLCYCRYILELPAVVELDTETIVASLAPVLQHYLTGDLDAPIRARSRSG
jgi:AcrR family transcriptional regulator